MGPLERFFERKTWDEGLAVVTSAPHIVIVSVAIAFLVGWLLRKRKVDGLKAEVARLKAESETLKAQLGLSDQHLRLVLEREHTVTERSTELQTKLEELQRKVIANAPIQELTASSIAASTCFQNLQKSQGDLAEAIQRAHFGRWLAPKSK